MPSTTHAENRRGYVITGVLLGGLVLSLIAGAAPLAAMFGGAWAFWFFYVIVRQGKV